MTLTGFNNGEAIEKVYNKIAEERKIEKSIRFKCRW